MPQIGFNKEMNINKDENMKMSIEHILENMKILNSGDLSTSILRRVGLISPKISPQVTFFRLEKLIPIVIYLELRVRNIPFGRNILVKSSSLTHQELRNFLIQLIHFIFPFK